MDSMWFCENAFFFFEIRFFVEKIMLARWDEDILSVAVQASVEIRQLPALAITGTIPDCRAPLVVRYLGLT